MSKITIERKLEVLGNNKIQVPGCEATSALTSVRMFQQMRAAHVCNGPLVDLDVALAAIPGSYVVYGSNFNAPRKRWLVFPPFDPSACPCEGEPDWYGVLRALGQEPEEETVDVSCDLIDAGFCPPKENAPAPQQSTYFAEGSSAIFGYYTP